LFYLKKQLIRRNGILEYIEEDETIDAVGGLEELKRWLNARTLYRRARGTVYPTQGANPGSTRL